MRLIARLLAAFLLAGQAFATQQIIPTATGSGISAQQGFQYVNSNFSDLYSFLYAPITGPVTIASGTNTSVIGAGALTNAMHANMLPQTVKCNYLTLAAPPTDCTVAQMQSLLGVSTGGTGTLNTVVLNFATPIFTATTVLGGTTATINVANTTQNADTFLASPCGGNGPVSMRSLCTADLPSFSGDITSSQGVATIAPGAVTLAKQAQLPANTVPCNATSGQATATYCTPQQLQQLIGATSSGAGLTNQVDLCAYPGVDSTGTSDSGPAVQAALNSVAGTAQELVVNCPVRIVIGYNPAAPIFVRSGSNVRMGAGGAFLVDNNTIHAFVFLNTTDVTWSNVNIQYVGALALNNAAAPYAGVAQSFNDTQMKNYLSTYYGNTFTGIGSNLYPGATNASSVIAIQGAAARLNFVRLKEYVPASALATNFIPVAVSIDPDWTPYTTVTSSSTVPTAANASAPTDINFWYPEFDGIYTGLIGSGGQVTIVSPKFVRYSDLQDASGNNQGGVAQWFGVPHAIHLLANDQSFYSHTLISDAIDEGVYVGGATRRALASTSLCSLRIDAVNGTTVNGYTSLRPDGLLDVLSSGNSSQPGFLKNISGNFNSSVAGTDGAHPFGVRFPSTNPYVDLTLQGLSVADLNSAPPAFPIGGNANADNQDVSITGLKVYLQDLPLSQSWAPSLSFGGTNISIEGEYHFFKTSTTTQNIGAIQEAGSTICVSCSFDLKLFGWRQLPVTFSAAISAGATTATLASSWPYVSGSYLVTFQDNEQRWITFNTGSTTLGTWKALSSGSTASGNLANGALTNNFGGYRSAFKLNFANGSAGVRARLLDVSNGYEGIVDNGVLTETWSQNYVGTPTGSSQYTNIIYPNTFLIDRVGYTVLSSLSTQYGLTGVSIGWSGATTALGSNLGITAGTNPSIPLFTSPALTFSPTTISLYAVGGSQSFGSTGTVQLTTRASQMSAAL